MTRLAEDGAIMRDLAAQVARADDRVSVAIVSVGGNDAVRHIGLLNRPATNAAETLDDLLAIADDFEQHYQAAVQAVSRRSDRTVLCTIYEVRLEPARATTLAKVPLALLNGRIIRTAARFGLDVLELRSVCTDHEDFVLQIEPSAIGARKIADAIAKVVKEEGELQRARVYSA